MRPPRTSGGVATSIAFGASIPGCSASTVLYADSAVSLGCNANFTFTASGGVNTLTVGGVADDQQGVFNVVGDDDAFIPLEPTINLRGATASIAVYNAESAGSIVGYLTTPASQISIPQLCSGSLCLGGASSIEISAGASVEMTLSNSGLAISTHVGLGDSTPDYLLDIEDSGGSASGVVDRLLNISHTGLSVPTSAVFFGEYISVASTDTVDHTADATHFGAGVFRSSDVAGGRTDSFSLEARNDARSTQASVESTAFLSYVDAVGAGTMSGIYIAGRDRACVSTDGDCATDNATGEVYGRLIEDVQGGAVGSNYALAQVGTDDFNIFMASSTKFGTTTTSRMGRVDIVQAGGAALIPALRLEGGGASNDVIISLGRNSIYEQNIFVAGAAGNWVTGSSAGDMILASLSTSNNIHFSAGINAWPELSVSNGSVKLNGVDNGIVLISSIPATQANITTADTFISFNSATGQEGSVAGTAVAGVIAFNTFTGAHWTRVDVKNPDDHILSLVESTGKSLRVIDGKAVAGEGEKGVVMKEQLVRGRFCKTRGSKSVMGFYAGRNEKDGKDTVLALGTGLAWVVNKGLDVENGELLMSSDVEGAVEIQDADLATPETERDDLVRIITVAKARQPIKWKPGEKRRKIAVVYTCG